MDITSVGATAVATPGVAAGVSGTVPQAASQIASFHKLHEHYSHSPESSDEDSKMEDTESQSNTDVAL